MSKVYDVIRKLPFYVLLFVLSVIYLACGFIAGYYLGYSQGQQDYFDFIEGMRR